MRTYNLHCKPRLLWAGALTPVMIAETMVNAATDPSITDSLVHGIPVARRSETSIIRVLIHSMPASRSNNCTTPVAQGLLTARSNGNNSDTITRG